MAFAHCHAPDCLPTDTDLCLVIAADSLLARTTGADRPELPTIGELRLHPLFHEPLHIGRIEGCACWLVTVDQPSPSLVGAYAWHDTRTLLSLFSAEQSQAVSCARQLLWWNRRHRYCGVCGAATELVVSERARQCPQCRSLYFPSASPAVIVAVMSDDRLLLAHNRNFRPGLFSLIAGFVDPGETLEQAVQREVREEVGIDVTDVNYVTSQPWSYPNSLMLGFHARHCGGDLTVDGKEIETAAWFARDALPDIPRPGTVARTLIDAWRRD